MSKKEMEAYEQHRNDEFNVDNEDLNIDDIEKLY